MKENSQPPQQIIYNYMSAADLDALIRAAEERGEKRGYEKAMVEKEAPMTTKQAAAYLSTKESTIRNWTADGAIKHHKIGGRNYYYKSELNP